MDIWSCEGGSPTYGHRKSALCPPQTAILGEAVPALKICPLGPDTRLP